MEEARRQITSAKLVELEDCLADLALVKEVVVLWCLFNRHSVLDEALEELGVLGEDLESRLEERANRASSELEPDVLVLGVSRSYSGRFLSEIIARKRIEEETLTVEVQALESDGLSVNAARRDHAPVSDQVHGKV